MNRFGQHASEPVWRRRRHLFATPVPPAVATWLFDPGSLTRRIQQACSGHFHVEVIRQGWARPLLNEATRLRVDPDHVALIREVYLYCDATPWVYARTILPHATLTGRQRRLAHLGSRPLGAALFADPGMRREEMEVTCLQARHRLFRTATAGLAEPPAAIWGRRSVFYTGHKPLLVNEIFLPPLLRARRRPGERDPGA